MSQYWSAATKQTMECVDLKMFQANSHPWRNQEIVLGSLLEPPAGKVLLLLEQPSEKGPLW